MADDHSTRVPIGSRRGTFHDEVEPIMSDDRISLDLRAELARIDRDRAETEKLLAETRKLFAEPANLNAESSKFGIEAAKLLVEMRKLDRERWWFPWLQFLTSAVVAAVVGAVVAKLIH
jgi:uncharacterized protein (UPF0335 family)